MAFSPDGRWIALAGGDGAVRLWTLAEPREPPRLLRGPGNSPLRGVRGVAFGTEQLFTVAMDNIVRSWTLPERLPAMACRRSGRNLTLAEWREYWGEQPYRRSCPEWGLPVDVIEDAVAPDGTAAESIARLVAALRVEGVDDARFSALWLADSDDADAVAEGVASFAEALRREPSLVLEELPHGVGRWNTLCWNATLQGHAKTVLPACETAVSLGPRSGMLRDSRGLARALRGDLAGAIEDFEFFLAVEDAEHLQRFKPERRRWVEMLGAGDDPFDRATLEQLRGG